MQVTTSSWVDEQEICEVDFAPLQVEKKKRVTHKRKNPDYLTITQLEKLFNVIDKARDAVVCLLAFSSGFRREEVLSLRVQDIDWDRKTVMLNKTKGGERRPVSLRDWIIPILKKWIRIIGTDSEYLFPSDEFGKGYMHPQGFYSQYEKHLRKAGLWIEDHKRTDGSRRHSYTFHTLRHSFSTYLLEKGVSPAKVQNMMRHSKLTTTMKHYAHIRDPISVNACDEAFTLKKAPSVVTFDELGAELRDPIFQLKTLLVKGKINPEEYRQKLGLLQMADSPIAERPSYIN